AENEGFDLAQTSFPVANGSAAVIALDLCRCRSHLAMLKPQRQHLADLRLPGEPAATLVTAKAFGEWSGLPEVKCLQQLGFGSSPWTRCELSLRLPPPLARI